jgi:glycosyltransferase involved in cell wall biosynthesis
LTADTLVIEGFGMVLLEAMACGLPAIATTATAGPDVLDDTCGRVVAAGETDQLVAALRWFGEHRDQLPALSRAARSVAERQTWENYRRTVTDAVAKYG